MTDVKPTEQSFTWDLSVEI